MKSGGQRFLKRCIRILFQRFSSDQKSDEFRLGNMNRGKVGDLARAVLGMPLF